MDSYIRPIDTKILQSINQSPGDFSLSGKAFDPLLKEKADGVPQSQRKPMKEKEDDRSARSPSLSIDLLVQMLNQEVLPSSKEAMGMEGVSMEGRDYAPIEGDAILKAQSDLIGKPLALEFSLGASLQKGEDHPGEEGSTVVKDPFSLWAEKEVAQTSSSTPNAQKKENGFHSKEGFDPYLLRNMLVGWMGDGKPSIPHSMLPAPGRIENIHFSSPTWGEDFTLEVKESQIFHSEKSTFIPSEGFPAEGRNPEGTYQTDPSLPPQASANTFIQGGSSVPISHADALVRPRPISSPEALPFAEQIGANILWLARNDGGRIRLSLEPPELGSLVIQIQKENNQIKATLIADNSMTKEILEAHQSQLQKSLEGDGFQLTQYDVFVQKDMASFQNSDDHWASQQGMDPEGPLPPTPQADPTHADENRKIAISVTLGLRMVDRWV